MSLITVIIPSWNSGHGLARVIGSVRRQTAADAARILVVDSSPLEARPEVVHARVVYHGTRLYPGAARNVGLSLCDTPFVAFLDDDCEALPGWLEAHLRCLVSGHLAVTGTVAAPREGNRVTLAECYVHFTDSFLRRQAGPTEHALTCNASYHRDLLMRIGAFREDLRSAEDIELSARVARATGRGAWFEPAATVVHHGRGSLDTFLRHQWTVGNCVQVVRLSAKGVRYHRLAHSRLLPLLGLPYRIAKIIWLSSRSGMLGSLAGCALPVGLGLVARALGEMRSSFRRQQVSLPTGEGAACD